MKTRLQELEEKINKKNKAFTATIKGERKAVKLTSYGRNGFYVYSVIFEIEGKYYFSEIIDSDEPKKLKDIDTGKLMLSKPLNEHSLKHYKLI